MAIHRRLRKAASLPLQALRRGREAVEKRRARRGLARSAAAGTLDKRLSAVREAVLTKSLVEEPWELFRVVHLPGWTHEDAAAAVGAWAKRSLIDVAFQAINVEAGGVVRPVIYIILTAK